VGKSNESLPDWLRPVKGATHEQTLSLWAIYAMTFMFGASVFMVASLLPVYMKTVLGATQTSIGTVEGLAISFSFWARGLSGIGTWPEALHPSLVGTDQLIVRLTSSTFGVIR